jgi:hypothetical protein
VKFVTSSKQVVKKVCSEKRWISVDSFEYGILGPYSDRSDLRFEALFVKEIRRIIE